MNDECSNVVAKASRIWAGYEATFCPKKGTPFPLDDSYVSPDLVEWGQVPLGWETFSVEGPKNDAALTLERHLTRIFPEAGCAADNVASESSCSSVELLSAEAHVFSVSRCVVHTIDSGMKSANRDELTAVGTAPATVGCRTLFYGPEDGSGEWPGDLMLILPRKEPSPNPQTGKRIEVELKFDPETAQLRGAGVTVRAMRRLEEDQAGTGASDRRTADSTVAAALKNVKTQGKQLGSARLLGLDARTVSDAIGGRHWVESPTASWAEGHDPGSSATESNGGASTLRLRGNIQVSFGLTNPSSAGREGCAYSFLKVSLCAPDGTRSMCVHREFTKHGEMLARVEAA